MLIDLKQNSSLGLKFDSEESTMSFEQDLQPRAAAIRTIDQMQEVLLDKQVSQPQELYYMFRDMHRLSDKSVLEEYKLRFDVTAIKPDCLNREFMKTAGHYHPQDFGELYEVLSGRCFCLLQRPDEQDKKIIQEAVLIEAQAGEKILIPPKFGHILINPGPGYLITANWVSSCFSSEYELYKKAQGAAYFVIKAQEGQSQVSPYLGIAAEIKKNSYFSKLADVSFLRPAKQIEKFGLKQDVPMYNIINSNPGLLDFLNHPMQYTYGDVFVK